MPVTLPLWCSGTATNVKIRATGYGGTGTQVYLSLDNVQKGRVGFPLFGQGTRTLEVSEGTLSAGLHELNYYDSLSELTPILQPVSLTTVVVEGQGASCSLDHVAGYDQGSFTNVGMDVMNRVLGPNRNFSDIAKRGLHFASETIGRNSDDSISAYAMGEGIWKWFFRYHQQQLPSDPWKSWVDSFPMYSESQIKPYMTVPLDQLPGRAGERMEVVEPCNTVSNLVYAEAAVWLSCGGFPFPEDDMATLVGAFNMLAAGSLFFHASATGTGNLADVFPMAILILEYHHLMVKDLTARATGMTQAEKDTVVYLGYSKSLTTDHARTLTSLFRTPYDTAQWESVVRGIDVPDYILPIATCVTTVLESTKGRWGAFSFLEAGVVGLTDTLLSSLGAEVAEWMNTEYKPTIAKVFASAQLCDQYVDNVVTRTLQFLVTFVEALAFQEKQIPVPQSIRDVLTSIESTLGGVTLEMEESWDLYNGEKQFCKDRSPHMSWHEKAAHGLLHFAKVAEWLVIGTTC